jgi:hypothetical protein
VSSKQHVQGLTPPPHAAHAAQTEQLIPTQPAHPQLQTAAAQQHDQQAHVHTDAAQEAANSAQQQHAPVPWDAAQQVHSAHQQQHMAAQQHGEVAHNDQQYAQYAQQVHNDGAGLNGVEKLKTESS